MPRKNTSEGEVLLIVLKIIGVLLKIIGILLLIILLLLLAAMCVPLHLEIRYEPDVTFRIRYLFVKYTVVGEKPPKKPPGVFLKALAAAGRFFGMALAAIKEIFSAIFRGIGKAARWIQSKIRRKPKPRPKKPPQPKKPEKKQSFFGALKEQRGFFGALGFFADIGKALGGAMVRIYRGIRIDRLVLHASVSGKDAADTAIQYGRICSGAFPALSFLLSNTRGYDPSSPKTRDIEIIPDFAGEGIVIYLIGELTVFPILMIGNLLWAVIKFAVAQIKFTSKLKAKKANHN